MTTAEPQSRYADVGGTSPAAAIVSGAAALVRAKFPQLSAADVIHRLTATADDIGPPGRDDECGFGRLNIVKALTADIPPSNAPTASSAPAPTTTTAAPTPTLPPSSADQAPASSNTPLFLGGLAGLVIAGALAAILAIRRRRP
ncbi:MAG: S8 family serine peptidase [Actinoplanes sp.]